MFDSKTSPIPVTGCSIWLGATAKGRPKVKRNGKMLYVSRIVCEAVNGPPPSSSYLACHKPPCREPLCVEGSHLYWGTTRDNAMDIPVAERKAMAVMRAEAHHRKVPEERKREIRAAMVSASVTKRKPNNG